MSQGRSGSSWGKACSSFASASSGRIGLQDPALRLDDLPERPEGDPLPVGQAPALAPAGEPGAVVEGGEELGDKPALAHPRLAHDRHQLAGALLRGALEDAEQQRLLELAADERGGVGAGDVRAEAGARRERAEERERLRLALHLHRLELLVLEDALGRAIRLLRDRDPVHRRGALQPRGGIDDVARHDPLALLGTRAESDDCLARVDPDPHLQRERWVFCVQLLDRLQDAKAGADGPLGVVLVRDGRSEDGHHRVPDELLDRARRSPRAPAAGARGRDGRAP